MKYKCSSCNKPFISPARVCTNKEDLDQIIEVNACPHCYCVNYDETVEPKWEEEIVSIKDVPLNEADPLLAQGYTVYNLYAKNAVLVKRQSKSDELEEELKNEIVKDNGGEV